MTYFEKAKNMITEAISDKELDNAKEYMYIHGFLMEMNQIERDQVRGLINMQRAKLNEQVSEFGYNEHVQALQQQLTNAGFSCGQDQAGIFSAGTFNALQTALNTYKQLKQGAQLNENSIDEIAWMSLPKHKNINKVDPKEWGDWATSNPNDATKLVTKWLNESNNNEDIILKVSQCIRYIPSEIAMYRTLREQLSQIYNNYVSTNFPDTTVISTGSSIHNTQKAEQETQSQAQQQPSGQTQQQGFGPANTQTFEMAGVVKNEYIKTIQNELKQTNEFIINTVDGTFNQETLTACEQLLYKINKLRAKQQARQQESQPPQQPTTQQTV